VPTTVIGFYELDAAPQRGFTGTLAERLGAVTGDPDFVDGALFVRSDNAAVVISLQHDSNEQAWLDRPLVAALIQSAEWRSRTSDVRGYRALARPSGGAIPDEAVYTIQSFDTPATAQNELTSALEAFVQRFARPISGFLDSEILASEDGARAVWVAPWAHEAALAALETPESFSAMRGFTRLASQRAFGTFERVSYVRAARADASKP
jgi:hypothetical protein